MDNKPASWMINSTVPDETEQLKRELKEERKKERKRELTK